jgi:uncharacterized protein YcnI
LLLARAGAALAVVAAVVLGVGAPASAHVTVNPSAATQGGFAKLTFRVPDEKDSANTVKIQVTLPDNAPIPSVSVKPVPGWTAQVQKRSLDTPLTDDDGAQISEVVSAITWTAASGAEIKPGQFQEFDVSVGPLPDVDQIVFKALQYYSDGDIVRWIDEPTPGVDLEHPAPVLHLTPAADDPQAAGDTTTGGTSGGSGVALGFGVAGAVLGLAGLALGLLAYRRTSSPPTP